MICLIIGYNLRVVAVSHQSAELMEGNSFISIYIKTSHYRRDLCLAGIVIVHFAKAQQAVEVYETFIAHINLFESPNQ